MNSLVNRTIQLLLLAFALMLFSCGAAKYAANSPVPVSARETPRPPVVVNKPLPKPVLKHRPPYALVSPSDSIARKYALLLGVKKADIKNGRLYNFIDQWLGTPYRFGGLEKDGIDCSGFVYRLQQQAFDIADMPRSSNLQINYITPKAEGDLREGDLVFFDYDGKQYSHVGIYLMNGYFVHASTSKGVIINKLHSIAYYKYFSRAGSVIDPADLPENQNSN